MESLFNAYLSAMEEYKKTDNKEWEKIALNHFYKLNKLLQNLVKKGENKYNLEFMVRNSLTGEIETILIQINSMYKNPKTVYKKIKSELFHVSLFEHDMLTGVYNAN